MVGQEKTRENQGFHQGVEFVLSILQVSVLPPLHPVQPGRHVLNVQKCRPFLSWA